MQKIIKSKKGATFIELLLYIAIFLVLTPILLSVAISSLNTSRSNDIERQVNLDAQFAAERIYDLITASKRVDTDDSVFNDNNGRLSLILQDDSQVIIELNPATEEIDITEGGITANLTSSNNKVEQLYFEKIDDNLNFPDLALGVNLRMKVTGQDDNSVEQDYVISANLDRGDYDDDGCLDYEDDFPYHAECCKDEDSDGMCDELDNCILEFNPFQEDYDGDNIGDACDLSAFFEGGTSSATQSLGSFNCAPAEDLIALIYNDPPLNSAELKNILMSASPLPEEVLWALEETFGLLTQGHFKQVILNNMGLPEDLYEAIIALNLTPGHLQQIIEAQSESEEIPSAVYYNGQTKYQLSFYSDSINGNWTNRVKFHTPDYPLCKMDIYDRTDVFVMDVLNGSDSIDVTTETVNGALNTTLTTDDNYYINSDGFALEFNEKVGNAYALLVTADSCTEDLQSVEINFGGYADIISPDPNNTEYDTTRYTSYCPGGCATNCGDVGTGVVTTTTLTDTCYLEDLSVPEWCSRWHTFLDNDSADPAYVGGTQIGEETAYWEKSFKTFLTTLQLEHLESITVGGQIAYQSITQFFCDTLSGSCPMNATLSGSQDVQLYNYVTDSWVTIGTLNFDESTSDQQTFEIVYNGTDLLDFFDQGTLTELKSRIKFSWDGIAPPGTTSAPSFMLIDYFTIHLKW